MRSKTTSTAWTAMRALKLTDLVARFGALPWPAPIQGVARRTLAQITTRFEPLASYFGVVRTSPSPDVATRPMVSPTNVAPSRDVLTGPMAGPTDVDSVDALIVALRDPSTEVGVRAALALADTKSGRARDALVDVVANVDAYYDIGTRVAAVEALGRILVDGDEAPLSSAIRDVEAAVSLAAIEALTTRGGAVARDELLRVVENVDQFYLPITRLAAARGLERIAALAAERDDRIERVLAIEDDPELREVLLAGSACSPMSENSSARVSDGFHTDS